MVENLSKTIDGVKVLDNISFTLGHDDKVFYHEDFISDLAVWTEINVRIFTARRTHIVKLDFFQGTLTGSCLLGFGCVGTESEMKSSW